ncbi:MAG TPA: MraY family glycosyltransferase [Anaerolineales bacterium]|nr:MraY family glycosyltransferase [Anaerolineales bacterium]
MISQLSDLFLLILVSASAAWIGGPFWIRLARRFALVDVPGSAPHKTHLRVTPLAGGLVLASALALAYLVSRPEVSRGLVGILVGTAVVVAGGLADDRRSLPPTAKLGIQLVAGLILIAGGVQVHFTRIPLLDILVTLLWVVGLTNAFNFVDSMDGLALGLAAVAASFFLLVTIDAVQPELAALSAALLGAVAGCLFYNITPAKLFLGDSGSQLLGFLLAALGIAYTPGQAGLPQALTWFIPIVVLGVPIFDATLVVVSRLRRRQPIYHAGLDHTYHRLVSLGLDSSRSVLGMQLAALLLALTAFVVMDTSVWAANAVFVVLLGVGVGLLVFFEVRWAPPSGARP